MTNLSKFPYENWHQHGYHAKCSSTDKKTTAVREVCRL